MNAVDNRSVENKAAPEFGSREALLVLGAILLGVYTAIPLPLSGSVYIPFVILFGVTVYLVVFHLPVIERPEVFFLCGMTLTLILNLFLSATPLNFFGDQLKAFLQIMAGLVLGIFTVRLTVALPRSNLISLLLGAVVLFYFLAILERTGLIRSISDSWRNLVYTGLFTEPYANDARDLDMVNFVRPKVFTAEPAFLAGFVFVALNALALACRRMFTGILAAGLAMVGFFLVGSPILILALVAIIPTILFRFPEGIPWVLGAAMTLAALILVNPDQDKILNHFDGVIDRFDELITGDMDRLEDASARSRLIVPFRQTVPESFHMNPLFGIGIGGKEYFSKRVNPNYSSRDTSAGKHEMTMGTNALGNLIATLGVAGFLMTVGLVSWFLVQRFGYVTPLFLPALLFFMFTRGAYETQSFWAAVFLLIGAAYAGNTPCQKSLLSKTQTTQTLDSSTT